MFEYLVTSRTRRALLRLMWGEGRQGSVADLAKWADVAFAGAHKELHAMEAAGLAVSEWKNGQRVFAAAKDHPMKAVLKSLVQDTSAVRSQGPDPALKEQLAYLGLPVNVPRRRPDSDTSLEALLAAACRLARSDASVARSLPVLLHKYQRELDFAVLMKECRKRGEKHTMGFFLDVTAHLSGTRKLQKEAERFRDHRRKRLEPFFVNSSKRSLRLAALKTPKLARDWNWLMNLSMDSFAGTFEKFGHAQLHAG